MSGNVDAAHAGHVGRKIGTAGIALAGDPGQTTFGGRRANRFIHPERNKQTLAYASRVLPLRWRAHRQHHHREARIFHLEPGSRSAGRGKGIEQIASVTLAYGLFMSGGDTGQEAPADPKCGSRFRR